MQKRTRLIILSACFMLFFTITPWLILYSLGYKIDVENQCIVATGGVYVRTEQSGAEVIIDSKTSQKNSIFSNSVFTQNLTPKEHTITVKKDEYFWYVKKINVKEKEVTKVENITLFKNNIAFEKLNKTLAKTIFNQEQQHSDILKNVGISALAYNVYDNNIIYLGKDGNLRKSDTLGKNEEVLTSSPLLVSKNSSYKIFSNGFGIFILKDSDLLLFSEKTGTFNIFLTGAKDLKVSPDGQNIFYATNNEIWLDHSNYEHSPKFSILPGKILLNKFYENISDIFWLNNNYLIMRANDVVKISEIDNRNNINIIDLPLPADFKLDSKSQINFNPQDKKLYILTSDGSLLSSDSLLP